MSGYCYILLCRNQAFYTGWTMDVQRRFQQHLNGKGANYTKVYPPLDLIYWESYSNHRMARKRELQLKKMTHSQKEKLISGKFGSMAENHYFQEFDYYVSSPGRVNLLGEHVDYNGGPVLPVAIDRTVSLWAKRSDGDHFTIQALDLDERVTFSATSCERKQTLDGKPLPQWALYPAGIVVAAIQKSLNVSGFEAVFSSTIPMGSGLSSSAAVEIAFCALLRELGGWQIDNLEIALLSLTAERDYVGVNCGIMDQFACANGIENAALYLDTASLEWSSIPLDADISIIIADSKIERSLASSAYNERRASCDQALAILQQFIPGISFLAQVNSQQLEQFADKIPAIPYKRAKHVIEECERVRNAVEVLKAGKVDEFGRLMREGHDSLKNLYEVSIPALDSLVNIANQLPGCYGSRMTGAGFGGCTVSLVSRKDSDKFIKGLKRTYEKESGQKIEVYACKASNGVSVQWRKNSSLVGKPGES